MDEHTYIHTHSGWIPPCTRARPFRPSPMFAMGQSSNTLLRYCCCFPHAWCTHRGLLLLCFLTHDLFLVLFLDTRVYRCRRTQDLARLGRRRRLCPYYGARSLLPEADVVALPYRWAGGGVAGMGRGGVRGHVWLKLGRAMQVKMRKSNAE